MKYPRVLTIAGSDSGGGAGIQADIKSISATGGYSASAITAVTVQNTLGVEAVHPVPIEIITAQIKAVLSDIGADAVKIGMLHSAEVVLAVRDSLLTAEAEGWLPRPYNIVLDPVMVSTSGHRLIEESAIRVLTQELLPLARVITPNIPEAEILIGRKITSQEELPAVARELSALASGASAASETAETTASETAASEKAAATTVAAAVSRAAATTVSAAAAPETSETASTASATATSRPVSVLMKAGHLSDDHLVDYFYNAEEDRIVELPSERIHTPNTHGTGCTLSSALASYLAQGLSLDDAARAAANYIHEAIKSGSAYTIGHGHGPVNHFWKTN